MAKPGSTTARGYGYAHRQARKRLQPTIDAGNGYCCETTCLYPNRWIQPGTPWHLAHTQDRNGYHGPAHAKCNLVEGAKRGYQAQLRTYQARRIMRTRW